MCSQVKGGHLGTCGAPRERQRDDRAELVDAERPTKRPSLARSAMGALLRKASREQEQAATTEAAPRVVVQRGAGTRGGNPPRQITVSFVRQ